MESQKELVYQSTCVEPDCSQHVFYQFGTKCMSHLTDHLYSKDSPRCDYIECVENIDEIGYSREIPGSTMCYLHTYELCRFPSKNGKICHDDCYDGTGLCNFHSYFVRKSYMVLFGIESQGEWMFIDQEYEEPMIMRVGESFIGTVRKPDPNFFHEFICEKQINGVEHNCSYIKLLGMDNCLPDFD